MVIIIKTNESLRAHNKLLEELRLLKEENTYLKKEIIKLDPLFFMDDKYQETKENEIQNDSISEEGFNYKLVNENSPNWAKVELYLSLFQGRKDVCAKYWQSKTTEKYGYSPYCINEWKLGICGKKQRVKCSKCENQNFVALDSDSVREHFYGKELLGLYPIGKDDKCKLIVMDFDKRQWKEEVLTIRETCFKHKIPSYVERSKSGNGAHIWFFFEEWISASKARKFANVIVDKAMESEAMITFEAYDRLIPSQDFLIKDGFGNQIALPIQGKARENGNSLFIDETFNVIEDQWKYLASIELINESFVKDFIKSNTIKADSTDDSIYQNIKVGIEDFPKKVKISISSGISIQKAGFSAKGLVYLRRKAAYNNPEFFSKQAMRISTYKTPRMTIVYEENEKNITLPIGLYESFIEELNKLNVKYELNFDQIEGSDIDVSFLGTLREEQNLAFSELISHNTGVLSATTGFGKTVIGAKMICERKCSTLILVHTKELALQWIDRLEEFIDIKYTIPEDSSKRGRKKARRLIGQLGGGKKELTGKIDVALMQSMFENKNVKDIIDDYGMVIVDECHHVSSKSFSKIMRRTKAKYIYGLTATPIRKDGHHPIIFMYCGPIRYKVDPKKQAQKRSFKHYIIPRFTSCRKPLYQDEADWSITDIMKHLCESPSRNNLIVSDIDKIIAEGRNPIVITERTTHISILKSLMKDKNYEVIELSGNLKVKERKQALERIRTVSEKDKTVIIATGKLIGEGFDLARLDTLVMAMPISWKGRVTQYAGRLHREFEGKKEVQIYDYIDVHISMAEKMYSKRLSTYKSVGYKIKAQGIESNLGDGIFNGHNYFENFLKDINKCKDSIVISCPYLQKKRYEQIKNELFQKYSGSVRIIICIKDIEEYSERDKFFIHKATSEMINGGIDVVQISGNQHKFAVLDNEVVWYGGINLMGSNRIEDSIIRIESSELGNELLGVIEEAKI